MNDTFRNRLEVRFIDLLWGYDLVLTEPLNLNFNCDMNGISIAIGDSHLRFEVEDDNWSDTVDSMVRSIAANWRAIQQGYITGQLPMFARDYLLTFRDRTVTGETYYPDNLLMRLRKILFMLDRSLVLPLLDFDCHIANSIISCYVQQYNITATGVNEDMLLHSLAFQLTHVLEQGSKRHERGLRARHHFIND